MVDVDEGEKVEVEGAVGDEAGEGEERTAAEGGEILMAMDVAVVRVEVRSAERVNGGEGAWGKDKAEAGTCEEGENLMHGHMEKCFRHLRQ